MILIVDSGATKADWTALNSKGEKVFFTQTLGLNPEVLTEEILVERITTNYQLFENRNSVSEIYFLWGWLWYRTHSLFCRTQFGDYL